MELGIKDVLLLRSIEFERTDDKYYILKNEKTNIRLGNDTFEDVTLIDSLHPRVLVKSNGKWGVYDVLKLEYTLNCVCDEYEVIYSDRMTPLYYLVKKDNKLGLLSGTLKSVIEPKCDSIEYVEDANCYIAYIDGKFGVASPLGINTSIEYEAFELFDENKLLVKKGSYVGVYFFREGILTPVEYNDIKVCERGCYLVQKEEKWGLWMAGKGLVVPCKWDDAEFVISGIYKVKDNGVYTHYADPALIEPVDLGLSVKWNAYDIPGMFSFGSLKPGFGWSDEQNPYITSDGKLLKYNNYSAYGHMDGLTRLLPEDDVATVFFGHNWRIPTYEEIEELYKLCKWETKGDNVIVTGPSGNSIKLKASSRYHTSDAIPASSRSHDLGHNGLGAYINDSVSRSAYKFVRPVYGESSQAKCDAVPMTYDFDSIEIETKGYVDLGLSVNWSSVNLGALSPELFGDYYSWGSLDSKECPENDRAIKRGTHEPTSYEKYNFEDNLSRLQAEDDVVFNQLGDGYRIPSADEMSELYSNCYWIDSQYNGVAGFKVVGPSGKAIFIPSNQSGELLWTSDAHDGQLVSLNAPPRPIRHWAKMLYGEPGRIIAVYSTNRYKLLNIRPIKVK